MKPPFQFFKQSRIIVAIGLAACAIPAAANSPQAMLLQGTILNPAGLPQEAASVAFTVELRSPGAENCLLFSESHTLNMTNSGGAFSLPIGSGVRSGAGFQATSTLDQVFDNGAANITGLTCGTGTSYDPTALQSRKIQITFDDGSGPQTLTQTLNVQSVPYALFADSAKTLGPLGPTDFLQTNILTGLTQTNVDSVFASNANVVELLALIAGTSSQYAKSAGAQTFSGAVSLTGAGTGLSVTNNASIGGTASITGATTIAGVTSITNNTASTSSATGAVVVTGGLGVGGAINAGTTMSAATSLTTPIVYGSSAASGSLTLQSTSNVTSPGNVLINPNGGNVGIGTGATVPGAALDVSSTSTDSGFSTVEGVKIRLSSAPASDGSSTHTGAEITAIATGSNRLTSVTGADISTSVTLNAPATAYSSYGTSAISGVYGSAPVSKSVGTSTMSFLSNTSSVTTAIGVESTVKSFDAATTVTTAQAGFFQVTRSAGTITNGYGVYTGNIEATNKWSIYANDATAPSYFAGNVGIGTSAPASKLEVTGNINLSEGASRSIQIPISTTGVGNDLTINAGNGDNSAGGHLYLNAGSNIYPGFGATGAGAGGNLVLNAGTGASGDGNLIFGNTAGNVGIGTDAPFYKTEINGTPSVAGFLLGLVDTRSFAIDRGGGITFNGVYDSSGTRANYGGVRGLKENGTDGSFAGYLKFETRAEASGAMTEAMRISSAGDVGIGVVNPGTKLQVAGVISPSVDNTYTLGDATHRFSDVYSVNAANNTSDLREKNQIQDSDLGLDFITKLRPVSYVWKSGVDKNIHYGLIAQETEKAVADAKKMAPDNQNPVIVTYDEKSDRYGIRYTELISPVIKAVQELYLKVVGHDENIQTLNRDLASLNAKLEADNAAKDKKIGELEQRLEQIEKNLNSK